MEFSKSREKTEAIALFQNAIFVFNITKLRKKLGISQKDIADKLSVSVDLYDEFEHCETTLSIIQAYEIADILNINLGDIIDKVINFENITFDDIMKSGEDNIIDEKIALKIIEYKTKTQQEK